MRRCFSAPTPSKPAGKSCSRSSTLGQTIRRGISRIMPQAAAALLRPTNCWRAMAAPGGRSTEQGRQMAEKRKISLVLTNVDGTLVTEEEILTEWARKAVSAVQEAGIRFATASGRPPLGMATLFDVLDIETPDRRLPGGIRTACDGKPVTALLSRCHQQRRKQRCRCRVSLAAPRITGARDRYHGDQPNDVLMFKRSSFSIAMGNASVQVNTQAAAVTDSYNEEGFAKAMKAFILGSAR